MVISSGPAGTGKPFSSCCSINNVVGQKIDRIILSRPAVEAGERLGFLPGDMREKVDPYLRPLYDPYMIYWTLKKYKKKLKLEILKLHR